MKKAVIAGSSGLVGSNLLQLLLRSDQYSSVTSFVRKASGMQHPRLKEIVLDFNTLREYSAEFNADVVFSCLGTTKAKTPDKVMYRKIEQGFPLEMSRLALAGGALQMHYISAIGASPTSIVPYLRFKGQAESSLGRTGLPSVYLYRPSLITGQRKENRPAEKLAEGMMSLVNPLLQGGLARYRSIEAAHIARAMYACSLKPAKGIHVLHADDIQRLSVAAEPSL